MRVSNTSYNEISSLNEDIELEILQYCHYQNDVLFDRHEDSKEFKNCLFESVSFQDVSFEDSYFIDVIFKDCDLSNIKFLATLFRRVQFINCKLLGTDFSESLFDQVLFKDCQCGFANFAFMKNKETHFINCDLHNASIIETNLNKTKFNECSLIQCEIQHSPLYNIDLSTCNLTNIITTPQDIQGAIIDSFQASSLIHLLRVKIKE